MYVYLGLKSMFPMIITSLNNHVGIIQLILSAISHLLNGLISKVGYGDSKES